MKKLITPTVFFDQSRYKTGNQKCYYCGSPCNEEFESKNYVKKTFTNRDIVAYPGSKFVCGGCVSSFEEKRTITLIDGEQREQQRVRGYSWILTKDMAIAAAKKHIALLRDTILNPPDPPFGIVIAVSGQKHLLFRSCLAYSRSVFPVSFEDKIILVNPDELKKRLDILKPIIAVYGKNIDWSKKIITLAILLVDYFGNKGEEFLNEFLNMEKDLLTDLAVWLSPNKEECKNECTGFRKDVL